MASKNKNKQQRRKWVRWERDHSMSFWHTDYKWFADLDRWMIAYEDDASRMLMSYDLIDKEITENAIKTLDEAIDQGVSRERFQQNKELNSIPAVMIRKKRNSLNWEEFAVHRLMARSNGFIEHWRKNSICLIMI